MLVLALFTGIGTFFNYSAMVNHTYPLLLAIFFQLILFGLTLISLLSYKGKRSRPSYDGGWYTIWTIPFALIILSFLGNLAVLVIFLLNQFGYLSGF
ncbi:hypothetical protein PF023_08825 [Enterococcus thailandicus]|uniref:hypothetical protein n=1 Tax=Enterococcus thailandicus TaxID=417368 RepID=UPI0022EC048B|nr:hypothetical protein [Enterococcus thailandicus]MDA3974146.1 hypothetical protein [Enterococcus thailandicus]MDA3976692.1 hypothetical protein [Enterococcus thailandicus]MDA3981600.1 hypothetical protein [Enterococcus thailandicus]